MLRIFGIVLLTWGVLVAASCPFEEMVFATYAFDREEKLNGLELVAGTAEITPVGGVPALELEGLLLLPDLEMENLGVEVEIWAEQPAYPGIVFRHRDDTDYELVYAVPHASGLPDAIQYDPVFHGSNTWQLHSGPAYQKSAQVPMGEWFTLRLDVVGERVVVQVDDQPPLVVEQLSHEIRSGRVGLWSFHAAFFRNLKVVLHRDIDDVPGVLAAGPSGLITEWIVDDVGVVACDPNGVLNLNRVLEPDPDVARVRRRFVLDGAGEVVLRVGFSDVLNLALDGVELVEGSNTFRGFDDLSSRGWVELPEEPNRLELAAGEHEIVATLQLTEPFGWGLIASLEGEGLRLLPAGPHSR